MNRERTKHYEKRPGRSALRIPPCLPVDTGTPPCGWAGAGSNYDTMLKSIACGRKCAPPSLPVSNN